MPRNKVPLGIKSGAQRAYEFLLDKPVGLRISELSHATHIPLHTGRLAGALTTLEKKGVLKAVGRTRSTVAGVGGRRSSFTVFEWLGQDSTITFAPGMRPGIRRSSNYTRKPSNRRSLEFLGETEVGKPFPDTSRSRADLEKAWSDAQSTTPPPRLEPGQPAPQILPPQPTLSEQILLLAIRIDRARKAGTPSKVFRTSQQVQEVALPRRVEVVEKLLELASLAEELEGRASRLYGTVQELEDEDRNRY